MVDWASTVGRELTAKWLVQDEEGNPLPLSDFGWDAAPADIVNDICTEAQDLYVAWSKTKRRPKVKSEGSSDATSEGTTST